ncbi:hypothetical protein IFM12276_30440 [Nocardia sputorum]|uniref:Tn3 transposase DDE domain-containing protein n=1 Tax=Nocardia sputorum TaxID=2984338 RepID=A0ABM8CYE0_9NOCA|nr:hypothetical protein IFM12276_30440 [Nocardia sputorum]
MTPNELVADCAIYSTALDIADATNALAAERHPVDPQGLATITPYVAGMIRRFGDRVLNLIPSDSRAATCLDPNPALRSRPARVAAVFASRVAGLSRSSRRYGTVQGLRSSPRPSIVERSMLPGARNRAGVRE